MAGSLSTRARVPARLKRALSWGLLAVALCAPAAPALSAGPAGAQPSPSPERESVDHACAASVPVAIRAAAAADAHEACEGARRALGFLAQAGLELPRRVDMELVERLPADLDGRAVGCYLPQTRRILLLDRRAFMSIGTWFAVPVNDELYRAAAAHEVAHAVAACNGEPGRLALAAHEYLAYVTMFATMEPRQRERILARFPGRGLANSQQIHLLVYLVDPLKFGADSWRHYLRQPDRAAWLRDIAAGQAVEQWPSEGP